MPDRLKGASKLTELLHFHLQAHASILADVCRLVSCRITRMHCR